MEVDEASCEALGCGTVEVAVDGVEDAHCFWEGVWVWEEGERLEWVWDMEDEAGKERFYGICGWWSETCWFGWFFDGA